MSDNVDIITGIGLLPVVILDDPDQAAPLAEALLAGGLAATEVTFRTPAAARGIEIMSGYPELFVAAGTVRTLDQLDAALAAGARMIVSPGLSESVVAAALEAGVPVAPGVATATEVQRAADLPRSREVLPRRDLRRRRGDQGDLLTLRRDAVHPDRRDHDGLPRGLRRLALRGGGRGIVDGRAEPAPRGRLRGRHVSGSLGGRRRGPRSIRRAVRVGGVSTSGRPDRRSSPRAAR